ncbi:MAG: hypothetical protein R2795_05675 [Saprospiraceae bacterium]
MRKIICVNVWITLFFLVSSCVSDKETNGENTTEQNKPYWKLICIGDELTAGIGVAPEDAYPNLTQRTMQQNGHKIKVVNAAIQGESLKGVNERIHWLMQQRFDAILLMFTKKNDGQDELWEELLEKIRLGNPDALIFVACTFPSYPEGEVKQCPPTGLLQQYDVRALDLTIHCSVDCWEEGAGAVYYLGKKGHKQMSEKLQQIIELNFEKENH